MKNLIICLSLLLTTVAFSQTKSANDMVVKETTKIENVAVSIEVDSAEDIESNFKIDDIKEILDASSENETVSFKIICNGDKMFNGKKSSMSYKVEGNSNNKTSFIKSVEKIRNSAIKYYKNKN